LNDDQVYNFNRLWSPYFPISDGNIADSSARFKVFSPLVFSQILLIQERSNELWSVLKDSPIHIQGIQLFKQFLIDLVGRDSKASKILENTFEGNLKATYVVSWYTKLFALLLMVGMNVYFVYMSMIYCSGTILLLDTIIVVTTFDNYYYYLYR